MPIHVLPFRDTKWPETHLSWPSASRWVKIRYTRRHTLNNKAGDDNFHCTRVTVIHFLIHILAVCLPRGWMGWSIYVWRLWKCVFSRDSFLLVLTHSRSRSKQSKTPCVPHRKLLEIHLVGFYSSYIYLSGLGSDCTIEYVGPNSVMNLLIVV